MSNVEVRPVEMACDGTAGSRGKVLNARDVPLGGPRAMRVRRTLPQRAQSLIGAWCFVDHYGPDDVSTTGGMRVDGHPHTGLQTVSWLFRGEIEHRDTTGAHALVRPGELNLMTAGRGIAHSEHSTSATTTLHGVQLWVALPERDRFTAEAVAFHEAVPGHHFQLALGQQVQGLPPLRRLADITAHIEGWALYAERLADEMGLYTDDVARLGLLAEDSARAARLVVDTGLHARGWSRQQAVDFLRAHTLLSEVDIQAETDRYVEWPGQALSYMVGRLKIQRLRSLAEHELGSGFDLGAFHDLVLTNGPLPMTALAELVENWVHGTRASDPRPV